MTAARFFDGTSSRAWPVTLVADGTTLHVVGEGIDRQVDGAALSFSPATAYGPARLVLADGALCEIGDREAATTLFAALGHRPAATDRLVSNTWRVLGVTAAFVLVMAGLYRWGVPWMADRIVDRAPQRWDDALGEQILRTLDERHVFKPSALSQDEQDRIIDRFLALKRPAGSPDVSIVFRKLGSPNALALPGRIVVVTDEIVDVAEGDEDALATVLAHELGHVAHRDALRQIARSTISSAIAAWYIGDVSSTAAVVAGGIGTLQYSRDAEHEADLYAVRTMRASGASTTGAAQLFRRLEAWEPPKKKGRKEDDERSTAPRVRFPEYLSTHPNTDDRIRLFEADDPAKP